MLKMQVFWYLFLALLLHCALCDEQADAQGSVSEERQLEFLVNVSASEGTNVSDAYATMGYDTQHVTNCEFHVYGTNENLAAGDRDMDTITTFFKRRFNTFAMMDPTTPLAITSAEVVSQKVGETVETRRLSENGRELQTFVKYINTGYVVGKYVCRRCSKDNRDTRRSLQDVVTTEAFVEQLKDDFANSRSSFLSEALETTGCLRLQCDNGAIMESSGCIDYPL